MLGPFHALQEHSKTQLESPMLTELYNTLVTDADCTKAELIMDSAAKSQFFSGYISECKYKPVWRKILPGILCTSK